jgi:CRISPR-associated protein Cmr5
MQTRQQIRAQFSLEYTRDNLVSRGNAVPKEIANFIVGTPTLILTNGLGQTLAFLLSKKDKQKKVFDFIKKWLCQDMKGKFGNHTDNDIDFLKSFNGLSQADYLNAQHETLKLLEWLKRYARAFQDDGKGHENG